MTAVSSPANGSLVSGAASVVFASRYGSVEINSFSLSTLYVRTDGVVPSSPWTQSYAVPPGERVVVPNSAPMWWQGYGPGANPGTTVNIVSASGSDTTAYAVTGV